ncbi:single-stranded-DNA-specific exonuclease RecJ [Methylophilaceae bacterium]|jgi:single-stranded-DNA-specific exonuclease|nr:single-stranded-DNA-specific exonuclease RecJ [Methylophilaceae bacterium]MDC0977322.1 single-stranded-DNA-specific exonuclease RecJ [Methylophilaceae bacterium]
MKLINKKINEAIKQQLIDAGRHPVVAQILAARKITSSQDVEYPIELLLSPDELLNCNEAANFLSHAIRDQKKITIVGDYDADGASGSSVAILGFRLLGTEVDFLIPSRFKNGYGLSSEIVDIAHTKKTDIIITVDNGIASFEGINHANGLGIDVIVTDHHLQAENLPSAKFIINPNQKKCSFPSKNLCGAGVVFYLLIALRKKLRDQDYFDNLNLKEPNLLQLLDLVALATIADMVKMDFNNRLLVHHGLKVIRSQQCNLGLKKIFQLTNKSHLNALTSDLSFVIAPKINAAGRMDDMSLGVACLTATNEYEAHHYAKQLIEFNFQRKKTEADMQDDAQAIMQGFNKSNKTICLFNDKWHQGVIGILASRLKENFYRPVIIFAQDDSGQLKGSARSIDGFHIRDAIDLVAKKNPEIILTFGGHAMAAGLTIKQDSFDTFVQSFEEVAGSILKPEDLSEIVEVDDSILQDDINVHIIDEINQLEWGNGFQRPLFEDTFDCVGQEVIKGLHTKLNLAKQKHIFEGIYFNYQELIPDRVKCLYTVENNKFNNINKLTLNIKKIIHE